MTNSRCLKLLVKTNTQEITWLFLILILFITSPLYCQHKGYGARFHTSTNQISVRIIPDQSALSFDLQLNPRADEHFLWVDEIN